MYTSQKKLNHYFSGLHKKPNLKIFALALLVAGAQQVDAANMQRIKASDPNVQIMGRVDSANPDNVLFSYPGVSINARFEGTSIKAVLNEYGSGSNTTTNYFNVIVDGGEPTVLKLSMSDTLYTLAEGLADGEHTVTLFKRTESNVGKVGFKAFLIDEGKSLLVPEPLPEKKMLFIGNSITCGYGNEVSTTDPDSFHFTSENENNYKAWGAITARNSNAQYHCVAFSGRGLFQNNNGLKTGVAPEFFNRIFPDEASSTWDHSKYVPDVVVINLGTNDFYAETSNSAKYYVNEDAFVGAYVNFMKDIKSQYPQSSIICAVGVMMSDGYPAGANQWTRIQNYVKKAVSTMNASGDKDVHYLMLDPQSSPYGEDWHPTAKTQNIIAGKLTTLVENVFEQKQCTATLDLGRDFTTMEKEYPVVLGDDIQSDTAVKYSWYKDGLLIANESGPTLVLNEGTEYVGTYRLQRDSLFCAYRDEISVTDSYLKRGTLANWQDDKKAAVVLTFDDWSNGHPKIAVPQLKKRNLVGTFNVVSSFQSTWDGIQVAFDNGNEIANHSKTHPDISKLTPADLHTEISEPENTIESNITGLSISTFAYPFGTFNDAIIDTLQAAGYVGARGVWPSSGNYTYNFATKADDYFNILTFSVSESISETAYTSQIANVIRGGGLLTYLYHSVNSPTVTDNNYSAVSEYKFEKQLDTLLAYSDKIWITTFSNALKYHREKNCVSLVEMAMPTDSLWVLNLTDTLDDNLYNIPLTIQLPLEGKEYDMVTQNGKHIIIDSVFNGIIQFKAVPDAGEIKLYNTGFRSSMEMTPNTFYNTEATAVSATVRLETAPYPIASVNIDLSTLGGEMKEMTVSGADKYEYSYIVPAGFHTGNYAVRSFVTDEKGNINTVKTFINIEDGIEINSFSVNSNKLIYTNTDSLGFTVKATDDSGIDQVLIDLGNIGGDQAATLTVQTDGSYFYKWPSNELSVGKKLLTVSVIDNTGNVKKKSYNITINKAVIVNAITPNTSNDAAFAVWPNPTSGLVSISYKDAPYMCHVYDSNGNMLISEINAKSLNLTDFPQGKYVIKLTAESVNSTFNIVKL